MRKKEIVILCLLATMFVPFTAHTTHLRAGEITVQRRSCSSYEFLITITVYLDTESGVKFGEDGWLDFGDGSEPMLVPEQNTIPRPDLGEKMGIASYTTTYTYSGAGRYTIRYWEPNRNEHVVNIDQSVNTPFYIETQIFLDPFLSCNLSLPRLLVPPIDRACNGVAFFHNPGAVDDDGDSLSFELIVPRQAVNREVWNYKDPADQKFYTNYQNGNEDKNGRPTFAINPVDGTLVWNAPGFLGEYNIAFRVIEWRKDATGVWRQMSYVVRDMQIIVEDCDNDRPELTIPNDTCVVAGSVLEETIYGTDPNADHVKIEVYSEVLSIRPSPATFKPSPPIFVPSTPPARLVFSWNTQCEHVKEQFYLVHFKITDNPARGPKLVTFKTWRIKVVGPAPEWDDIRGNTGGRSAVLTWDPYTCSNATRMQVWRRIDGNPFTPGTCETGMPAYLGYSLVATVSLKATDGTRTQFVDTNEGKGLAPGATYCYRLVAVFPDPKGGESYLSRDTCFIPVRADVPVITNVSVERTDASHGSIRVKWYPPFDIDRTEFPGPYQYEVYRADGFDGEDLLRVTPDNRISDTMFLDTDINTKGKVYNYRIVLFSNTKQDPSTWVVMDTSDVASSVRLEAQGLTDQISLGWNAAVPWLNRAERFPYHLVYRGGETDVPENFVLMDSASVISGGFSYLDKGQRIPIRQNQTYCYRVLTRGVYGNASIHEPLENFSQVFCVKPEDHDDPCAPVVSLTRVDCRDLFLASRCSLSDFSNRIYWSTPCATDVQQYRVYVASGPGGEFSVLADQVVDTFYVDKNLTSFARCYRVTALDAHGNESEWSEAVCGDNCPNFELPNVFTPNGDARNDLFSAYGPYNPLNAGLPGLDEDNYIKCLRFVQKVSFRVFDRWGKEVYTFSSTKADNSPYINWNGRNNEGEMLSSGIYYYQADVSFDVLDQEKKNQQYKGWVHLAR